MKKGFLSSIIFLIISSISVFAENDSKADGARLKLSGSVPVVVSKSTEQVEIPEEKPSETSSLSLRNYNPNSMFKLYLEPVFGFRRGQLDEFVYLKTSNYGDDKLSELNWEYLPEIYGGFNLGVEIFKIFAEAGINFGMAEKTGLVKDSDWYNNDPATVKLKNALTTVNCKTNYSECDNNLKSDINVDVKLGYRFGLNIKTLSDHGISFNIKPFAGFQYKYIKFDGENGKYAYGKFTSKKVLSSWNDIRNTTVGVFANNPVFKMYNYYYDGRDISYERQNYIIWAGADVEVSLPYNLGVNAGFQVSPYLYSESIDTHHYNSLSNGKIGTKYGDVTPGYFSAFKWNLGLTYNITERQSVSLNGSYYIMKTIRGKNFKKGINDYSSYTKNEICDGGAGEHSLDFSVSYKFKIF